MSQEVPGPPRRYSPPKGYPTLKFPKSSGPRKYTTSKFSTQIPQISVGGGGGGFIPDIYVAYLRRNGLVAMVLSYQAIGCRFKST